jgi:hypothetical protein
MNSEESVEENNDKIFMHTAKITTDKNGYIYKPKVLNSIGVGHVVRLSFEVDFEEIVYWTHDAPYVKILMTNKDGYMVGEIQNINRVAGTNKYPLMVGDRIWFKLENIIEIPSNLYGNDDGFTKFITKDFVRATGPLYTIETSDVYSCDGSSSSQCSCVSDENSDTSSCETCSDSD